MINGVIFDMDGTMFDTERMWATFWDPALKALGLPYKEGLAEAARGTAGETTRNVVRSFYGPDCDADGIVESLHRVADEVFLSAPVPKKPGLDALLACIEAAGAGRLEGAPPLPPDSDFHGAAEQLSHMEEGLRTALAEQVRSERMKVELITNVSHDLKTPLTSIISYTELLQQEEGLPDHVQDYIRVLSDKSKRLQVMVRDVFEVSKAATGNLSVDIKPIDFAKLLRQTLADMGEAIEESGLALRPRLPESPVWIAADGDRLYRVFQNLIGNALKYSLEGSRIYLELTAADGQAAAVLRNTSREELPDGVDLTERFVRGDESRTDGGSGLGLSIARTFTEACGGTFSVQTQADLFTASVSFPLTRERPPKEESAV